jgi:hypothetical protein
MKNNLSLFAKLCNSLSNFHPLILSVLLYLINGCFYEANFWHGNVFFLNLVNVIDR